MPARSRGRALAAPRRPGAAAAAGARRRAARQGFDGVGDALQQASDRAGSPGRQRRGDHQALQPPHLIAQDARAALAKGGPRLAAGAGGHGGGGGAGAGGETGKVGKRLQRYQRSRPARARPVPRRPSTHALSLAKEDGVRIRGELGGGAARRGGGALRGRRVRGRAARPPRGEGGGGARRWGGPLGPPRP